jgi:hypothetical protein
MANNNAESDFGVVDGEDKGCRVGPVIVRGCVGAWMRGCR